jgi:hypothetical protein
MFLKQWLLLIPEISYNLPVVAYDSFMETFSFVVSADYFTQRMNIIFHFELTI